MRTSAYSVIIVEDEPLLAAMLAEEVRELGWEVVGIAHSEESAFALLSASNPDVAILNIDLGLGTSLAVAASCRDRKISLVFTSGDPPDELWKQCRNAPILVKPFLSQDLDHALDQAIKPTELNVGTPSREAAARPLPQWFQR